MNESVLFRELESVSDKKLAIATLNAEGSLNALTLEMVQLLKQKLLQWQSDGDVAMVIIEGCGDKAFCAGGDVVKLYQASVDARSKALEGTKQSEIVANDVHGSLSLDVIEFFRQEYELDYLIHTYSKPVLCWGHGIVMGGGLGLFAGASHRVVTERSRIAMPEITIGLYPDVGGTHFLNKMPDGMGLFLGLTGASINASDAKQVQLADHFVLHQHKGELIEALLLMKWGDTSALNHQKLSDVLIKFEQADQVAVPRGNITNFKSLMTELAQCETAQSAVAKILDVSSDDKWMLKAQDGLAKGSALTAHIVFRQLQLGKTLSLADCFKLELGISCNCSAIGEFAEGVRALLIDKDYTPNWLFDTVHDVEPEMVDKMFRSPWLDNDHPLSRLGS